MNALVKTNAPDQSRSRTISDATLLSLAGLPTLMYGWSQFRYAPRAHETALLSGEAAANAYAVSEVLKLVTRRERPTLDGARGNFASSAVLDGSFPSNHAAVAWSIASVIGSAYPGWLTRLSVYSVATGVSVSRITAKDHFPSDVLVGSAAGWLIGRYVYRTHHNADLDLHLPGDFGPSPHQPPDPIQSRRPHPALEVDADRVGSTFVPMDSWIYPALDRLAAMGLIESAAEGTRPWTRMECWRQLQEAEEHLARSEFDSFSG
jgi:membrane-associated phospholipid phosphatase